MKSKPFKVLEQGKVLLEYGPIYMLIETGMTDISISAAKRAISCLEELVPFICIAKQPIDLLIPSVSYPEVLNRMIFGVKRLNENDFTAMASVAGAISDLAKATAECKGAQTIIINNGGDVAIKLDGRKEVIVGIINDLATGMCSHVLRVKGDLKIGGIATSGFGGRSLTKGISSAVTAVSINCTLADAAATSIANSTFVQTDAVERCPAEALDVHTDIRGHLVTARIGKLDGLTIEKALKQGLKRAKDLIEEEIIHGAIIYVQGYMVMMPEGYFSTYAT